MKLPHENGQLVKMSLPFDNLTLFPPLPTDANPWFFQPLDIPEQDLQLVPDSPLVDRPGEHHSQPVF